MKLSNHLWYGQLFSCSIAMCVVCGCSVNIAWPVLSRHWASSHRRQNSTFRWIRTNERQKLSRTRAVLVSVQMLLSRILSTCHTAVVEMLHAVMRVLKRLLNFLISRFISELFIIWPLSDTVLLWSGSSCRAFVYIGNDGFLFCSWL